MHRFAPGISFLRNDDVVVQPTISFPLHALGEHMHNVESDSSFVDIKRQPVTRPGFICFRKFITKCFRLDCLPGMHAVG